MKFKQNLIIVFLLYFLSLTSLFGGNTGKIPTTRQMNFLCWQEFAQLVPGKINTVLLPVGSLEPHGVIPSGTDSLAPQCMAEAIAQPLNALIAPTLNYGVTPRMQAYPGAVSIKENSYAPFIKDILTGLADNKFKNIIILNGHGGNTVILKNSALKVSNQKKVRILVVNWWALTSDVTKKVFGEDGGHAGNNETAYIQAVYPQHIHQKRYHKNMTITNPKNNAFYEVPVSATILLYKKGQGFPTFNPRQAKKYFTLVNQKVQKLIQKIIKKWDSAKIYSD